MLVEGIKSGLITPKDDLFRVLVKALRGRKLKEKTVVVISSKVVAVTEGRIVRVRNQAEFDKLVGGEADALIPGGVQKMSPAIRKKKYPVTLAVKNGIFIPWAGVDRSNVKKGYAVLWPGDPCGTARRLRLELKNRYKVREIGVIVSDSFCAPLRKGVTAVALGYDGFAGVVELAGKKDLFGKKLKVSRTGVADMLAAAAHLVMGESDERTPFAIISAAPVKFIDKSFCAASLVMDREDCLFAPLYQGHKW